MANRAIISIAPQGHTFAELGELARRIDAGERLPEADYRLRFASAAQLFSELTPARLALLEALKLSGAQSIRALAKRLERNYSNVHSDARKLMEHDLVAKDAEGRVFVRGRRSASRCRWVKSLPDFCRLLTISANVIVVTMKAIGRR